MTTQTAKMAQKEATMTTRSTDAEPEPGTALEKTNGQSGALAMRFENLPDAYDVVELSGARKWVKLDTGHTAPIDPAAKNDRTVAIANVVEGLLLGQDYVTDGDEQRAYFRIQVARPCVCEWKEDEQQLTGLADVGEIVCLGARAKLAPLEKLVAGGGLWAVFVRAAKVIRIKGGQTMWTFDIGKRLVRAAAPAASTQTQDDLPF